MVDGKVNVFPVQDGAGEKYGIARDEGLKAVILIEDNNGEIHAGAAGVLRLMSIQGSIPGALCWWLYRRVGLFRLLSGWIYRLVARNRYLFPGGKYE